MDEKRIAILGAIRDIMEEPTKSLLCASSERVAEVLGLGHEIARTYLDLMAGEDEGLVNKVFATMGPVWCVNLTSRGIMFLDDPAFLSSPGDRSIGVGGDVSGSVVVTGDNATVSVSTKEE